MAKFIIIILLMQIAFYCQSVRGCSVITKKDAFKVLRDSPEIQAAFAKCDFNEAAQTYTAAATDEEPSDPSIVDKEVLPTLYRCYSDIKAIDNAASELRKQIDEYKKLQNDKDIEAAHKKLRQLFNDPVKSKLSKGFLGDPINNPQEDRKKELSVSENEERSLLGKEKGILLVIRALGKKLEIIEQEKAILVTEQELSGLREEAALLEGDIMKKRDRNYLAGKKEEDLEKQEAKQRELELELSVLTKAVSEDEGASVLTKALAKQYLGTAARDKAVLTKAKASLETELFRVRTHLAVVKRDLAKQKELAAEVIKRNHKELLQKYIATLLIADE